MTSTRSGPLYQLRLAPGEDIPTAITGFVARHRIGSGLVIGLGAAERVVLGFFDRKRRRYVKRRFPAECEVASLVGNIAWAGGEPVCHLHAVIATAGFQARAGHLFEARVTVTCEVSIVAGRVRLERSPDPDTGLKLLVLGVARRPAGRRKRARPVR